MAQQGSILGNAVERREDPALVSGAGTYVDNLTLSGAAHVAFYWTDAVEDG